MKKIFTILLACLTLGAFAATEPAWYNDVTSIANNGQYYIYSVNGKGFMQGGQSKVKTVNQNNYTSNSDLLFTINTSSNRTYCGSNYLCSYETQTCGPTGGTNTGGSTMIWENKSTYWLVYGSYSFIWSQKAYLWYENKYDATCLNPDLTDTKFHWYLISPAQYDRHWAIYLYDRYKETISDYTQWENLVPAAYYTALAEAYAVTYDVKNAEHSKETVNAHRADLKALYENAAAVAEAYANAKDAINALEAVEDKGEDATEVTAGISNARTAIEQAMSVDALNAAVSAPALKAVDPITFNVTTFMAGQALGTPASTVAGRAITYDAADKTIINAAGQPIYKGTTTLTATAAATNEYYKFVRSAQVTVNALPTSAEENKTITYGAEETWNGYDLSTYAVGSHSLVYETTNAQGGVHTITLTLTVNKMATLEVPETLEFCVGGSETYRGVEYSEAGTFNVPAEGATRDTIYNVTVTILQPTFGTDAKTIVYGAEESWNGIDLSQYAVGTHNVPFTTTNVAGCDSTVTLALTVNKQETLDVPVELSFCEGGSETYRGVDYTDAGMYDVPAEGATRDTVYQVTVTILEPTSSTETKTIVYGAEEIWNGIALGDSTVGVHTVTYVTENAVGCDSTVTLTLTVNKIATLNVPVALSFCPGGSESYRGTEYTEAGTYDVPAEGATRDTVYQVMVTILEPTSSTETMTIVYGAEEIWNGIALADSTVGVHTVTYVTENAAGCDSTVTLTLTVNKIATLNVPVELAFCAGGSETYRGTEYTEAGTYDVPAEGEIRDTVYNVTVTVLEPTTGTDNKTMVYGEEEYWNGIALQDSTVGVHTLTYVTENVAGCDSTVTLTLTVTKQNVVTIPVELAFCEGDSAEYRETWYKEEGLFPIYIEGEVSDTLYNVQVTVNKPDFTELFAQETAGEYFVLPEGVWYLRDSEEIVTEWTVTKADTAGLWFMEYLQNVNGCDSITKFYIAVHVEAPVELHEPLSFCPGDSVEFRGKWYTESVEDTLYIEDAVRDTIIYVEAVLLPIADITVLRDTVLSGHDVILPEGEWIIGEDTVSGAYSTVQSGDASEIVFRQYDDTFEGCGEAYIELIVTLTPNFEAIENVQTDEVQSIKFIRDGVLYIRRGERNYVVDGRLVR